MRVSPEERTSTFDLAISRDIANNECESVLRTWRKFSLSATGKIVVLQTTTERYWYALQQREWFSTVNAAVHRTTFRWIHDINRLMKTTAGNPSCITDHFCSNCRAVSKEPADGSGKVWSSHPELCVLLCNNHQQAA